RSHRDAEGAARDGDGAVPGPHRTDVRVMTKFLSLLADGLALGAVYALVALGFVVIFRATGVINFAQGGLVVFGAFLVYQSQTTWDWFGGGENWAGFIPQRVFALV